MKAALFSCALLLCLVHSTSMQAQCTITQGSVIVNIKSITNDATGCTTTFDLTFDLAGNGGNKWSHIHFWDVNAYPSITYGSGSGPNLSTLNGGAGSPKPLLATVSLDYHNGTNSVSSSYPADGTVPVVSAGISYTRTTVGSNTRFAVSNITVHSNNCAPLNLNADVWSAQDNNGKIMACSATGVAILADEPLLRGVMQCGSPRTFTLGISTKEARAVTFTAYKDVAPYGVFDANDQLPANIVNPAIVVNNAASSMAVPFGNYGPYAFTHGNEAGNHFNIWVIAKASGVNNSNGILIDNSCAPLPVTFKSFTATRNKENVSLKWITASEENSLGFQIQRKTGNEEWKNLEFIASLAPDGTSNSEIAYEYTDMNASGVVTQYRIKQVDMDNKYTYSEIKAIKGQGQQLPGLLVYPNPARGGNFSILLADNAAYSISIMDASGRMVKQFAGVKNSKSVTGLKPGQYLITTQNGQGVKATEKIIVQ